MHIVKGFLNQEEIDQLLNDLNGWQDGHTLSSKEHKDNSELMDQVKSKALAQKIQQHPYAITRLFMKSLTLPRFNRYKEGQKYARHIDAFKQNGIQTDWSYTVLLQAPEEGGELEIEINGEVREIKLEPGDVIFYPSGHIHQVKPVIKGERIAAIGWIESLLTRPDEREIVSNLVDVMKELDNKDEYKELVTKLSQSYHNLLRLWSK